MRKIIIPVLLALGTLCPGLAQTPVDFRQISYDQALEMAREQDKIVFVDCYAVWCKPCMGMDEEVFSRTGDFFNDRFINIKVDIDRHKELASELGVRAVPTFFLISPQGEVMTKIIGASGEDDFLSKIRRGMNPETALPYLSEQYSQRTLSEDELFDFWMVLAPGRYEQTAEVAAQIRERVAPEKLSTEPYWPLFQQSEYGDESFTYLEEHIALFIRSQGKQKIEDKLMADYRKVINKYTTPFKNGSFKDADQANERMSHIAQMCDKYGFTLAESHQVTVYLTRCFAANDIDALIRFLDTGRHDYNPPAFLGNAISIGRFIKLNGSAAQRSTAKTELEKLVAEYPNFLSRNQLKTVAESL